MDKAVTVFHRP